MPGSWSHQAQELQTAFSRIYVHQYQPSTDEHIHPLTLQHILKHYCCERRIKELSKYNIKHNWVTILYREWSGMQEGPYSVGVNGNTNSQSASLYKLMKLCKIKQFLLQTLKFIKEQWVWTVYSVQENASSNNLQCKRKVRRGWSKVNLIENELWLNKWKCKDIENLFWNWTLWRKHGKRYIVCIKKL